MERDSAALASGDDVAGWTWPPLAPVDGRIADFDTERWASATCVRHPWLRVGRWTLLYRRAA